MVGKKMNKIKNVMFNVYMLIFFSILLGVIITVVYLELRVVEKPFSSYELLYGKLDFTPDVIDELNDLYSTSDVEFGVCLDYVRDLDLDVRTITSIDSVSFGTLSDSNINYISFSCENTLIKLHSHPAGTCKASMEDVKAFMESDKFLNIIMCGVGKFVIYHKNKPSVGYLYEVD